MPCERCLREMEGYQGSQRRRRQSPSLANCTSQSFPRHAVEALLNILLITFLTGNMNYAEESCKELKNYVLGIHCCLGKEVSQSILNHITAIRRKIEVFNRQPMFRNVMELFIEAVVHPEATIVLYTPDIDLFVLQYLAGPLLKRHTFKKFIFDPERNIERYRWQTTNKIFQDVVYEIEKDKFKNQEENGEDVLRKVIDDTPVRYTLEDFLNQLDSLEVFIHPVECRDSYLLCQTSWRTMKIVDVCLSPRITNNAILFLGSLVNLVGLNILHTNIDQAGTVTLLEKLLETSKHSLKYFLSTRMFTPKALNLLHQFPLMNDVESSLRFFSNLHDFPMPFHVYDMIIDSGRLRGEKLLGYEPPNNV